MKRAATTIVAAILVASGIAGLLRAQQPNFPQVMPADSVYGSEFVTGPGIAISFTELAHRLFQVQVPFVSGTPQVGWVPQATSSVTASWAPARIKLTASLGLHSDTSLGVNQAGCGLGTGTSACKTLNYLYNNILVPNYDIAGQTVTLSFVANDSTCLSVNTTWVGGGIVQVVGPGGSPPSIGITCTGLAVGVNTALSGVLGLTNFKISGGSTGIFCQAPNVINYANINFGAESFAHIQVSSPGCKVACTANYTISGGSSFHQVALVPGSNASCQNATVTLSGTPAFSGAYAGATVGGSVTDYNITYSGSATGTKCFASVGGLIDTATGNPSNVFPGNSNCVTATGGLIN